MTEQEELHETYERCYVCYGPIGHDPILKTSPPLRSCGDHGPAVRVAMIPQPYARIAIPFADLGFQEIYEST